MLSSKPPSFAEDETDPDGLGLLVDRVTRLEHFIGREGAEGIRGDIKSISRGQLEMFAFFTSIDRSIVLLNATLAAHEHRECEHRKLDDELHETERQADAQTAQKRYKDLADKLDKVVTKVDDKRLSIAAVLAGELTLFIMLAVLLARGCA